MSKIFDRFSNHEDEKSSRIECCGFAHNLTLMLYLMAELPNATQYRRKNLKQAIYFGSGWYRNCAVHGIRYDLYLLIYTTFLEYSKVHGYNLYQLSLNSTINIFIWIDRFLH